MKDINLLNGFAINISEIIKLSKKPVVFTPGEELFWNDEHISKGMLSAHLDPDIDAASRKPETIKRTVKFLGEYLKLNKFKSVLDIGCGPGLYCERFYEYGAEVVGLDFSKRSIDYAQKHAEMNNLKIQYVYQNYLNMSYKNQFDAVFLIYYDFGTFSHRDNIKVLKRVHDALKPGGVFIFDVTTKYNRELKECSSWSVYEMGFWKPVPHIVLENTFHYEESNTLLDQYIVIEKSGETSIYRIYEQYYDVESLSKLLADTGFVVQDVWSDLMGTPYSNKSKSIGICARK